MSTSYRVLMLAPKVSAFVKELSASEHIRITRERDRSTQVFNEPRKLFRPTTPIGNVAKLLSWSIVTREDSS